MLSNAVREQDRWLYSSIGVVTQLPLQLVNIPRSRLHIVAGCDECDLRKQSATASFEVDSAAVMPLRLCNQIPYFSELVPTSGGRCN